MPFVYIAALTYRRPEGLSALMDALDLLGVPDGWDARFLIIDNDPAAGARSAVADRAIYVHEPSPGIPAARNRALREASDAEILCFLDDDEIPEPDWLIQMIRYWETSGAVLVGGPLRRTMPKGKLSFTQKFLGRSLIARRDAAEKLAARKSQPVYTSNWLGHVPTLRKHDLWFDETMVASGGSDLAFYNAVISKGLSTGWCPSAIVSEPIEVDRLSIGYQFKRSRSQGVVMATLSERAPAKILLSQIPRAAIGAGLMIVPAFGIASFSMGLHLFGSAIGHFQSLSGRASELYAR